jgi:hypothetical protein
MIFPKKSTFIVSLISAIAWSSVYYIFFQMHGMDKMFNDGFIFVFAEAFNLKVSTIYMGLMFSFFDGAVYGFVVWKLIRFLGRVIEK